MKSIHIFYSSRVISKDFSPWIRMIKYVKNKIYSFLVTKMRSILLSVFLSQAFKMFYILVSAD